MYFFFGGFHLLFSVYMSVRAFVIVPACIDECMQDHWNPKVTLIVLFPWLALTDMQHRIRRSYSDHSGFRKALSPRGNRGHRRDGGVGRAGCGTRVLLPPGTFKHIPLSRV